MIFIEQQVYDVSRLFLVKKKKKTKLSSLMIISADSSLKKYFLCHEIKLVSELCEFFNDIFYLVSSSKR